MNGTYKELIAFFFGVMIDGRDDRDSYRNSIVSRSRGKSPLGHVITGCRLPSSDQLIHISSLSHRDKKILYRHVERFPTYRKHTRLLKPRRTIPSELNGLTPSTSVLHASRSAFLLFIAATTLTCLPN